MKNIVFFAIPLIATGLLQLLYNAADIAVVGKFAGDADQAAVGSTGAIINLLVNLFMGFSVGACVSVSRHYGERDMRLANRVVHTAMTLSAILGLCVAVVGFFVAPELLKMTGTPAEVEPKALDYLRVYFLGVPAALVYNFGASILRAVGDTRRPLYYLAISGAINVALNLFFVTVFHMGAAGVALATSVSQVVSATLVVMCLARSSGCVHLNLRKLRIEREPLVEIVKVGLPAGLQSTVFSLSNILIQSSVNSFGMIAMAGNTNAQSLDGFINVVTASFGQAALSFVAQNMGAGEYRRVGRVIATCLGLVAVTALCVGGIVYLLGPTLLGAFYTDNPLVVEQAMQRLRIMCATYFICGLMDVSANSVRGIGHSLLPMLVTLIGACGLRIVWIKTVFEWNRSLPTLYLSYPVTWGITFAVHLACIILIYRKLVKAKATCA